MLELFYPRNVCTAMLRMAQLENLPPNSILRDDSCGTGGLLVSAMIQARSADYPDAQNTLTYRGSDNNPLYTSFAKANMFLHLSCMLETDPVNGCAAVMAIVNDSIECTAEQNPLGSLHRTPQNQAIRYVSNPPFTVAVGDITAALGQNAAVAAAYSTPGTKEKKDISSKNDSRSSTNGPRYYPCSSGAVGTQHRRCTAGDSFAHSVFWRQSSPCQKIQFLVLASCPIFLW